MHQLQGQCHCGNLHLIVELTQPPSACNPRVCDCDFCRKHGASYVSDPEGSLRIEIENPQLVGKYRQGSGIADCLICTRCGVLIGVLYEEDGHRYATVNCAVLDDVDGFGSAVSVSPKRSSAGEKTARWKTLWFSRVALTAHES